MRILLINPKPIGYTRSVSTPLGLLSIGSSLPAAGYASVYPGIRKKYGLKK